MKQNFFTAIGLAVVSAFIVSCTIGPHYHRPSLNLPNSYKEAPKGWKIAQPADAIDRGDWWQAYDDPDLNRLENQLNISNQNIAQALAQYQQATAQVNAARAGYFPTVSGSYNLTRQHTGGTGENPNNGLSGGSNTNNRSLILDSTWELDLWGSIRQTVQANRANAESLQAALASARLSAQASLAQYYFELRTVDADQGLLNQIVQSNQESVRITQNRYEAGTVGQAELLQAQSQLEQAKAQAINNGITRSQYEHAIAVLIGQTPEAFHLDSKPLSTVLPKWPLVLPSVLLERRPDVAQAERLVAKANAQIGVEETAFFPNLDLNANGQLFGIGLDKLLSLPTLAWSLGTSLSDTLFDAGSRYANVKAAKANYRATVASYRQTVLSALQEVEDNLVALKLLQQEALVQTQAANQAQKALKIVKNQYRAGTAAYLDIMTAQISSNTAEKNLIDLRGLQLSASVGLIKSLGGHWNGK